MYQNVAKRVMEQRQIKMNDLYALILPQLDKYRLDDNNVHFTLDGYQLLTEKVAKSIQSML